jgi:hypothetical protein
MLRQLRWSSIALGLTILCLTSSARAADLNKLLPDDTETVMSINVRQILDSAIVQKYGKEKIKDLLESQAEVKDYLKDLGLDPLKDIDTVVVGSAGAGDKEKGLVIITGRFDPKKFEAKAGELAKDKPDLIKIVDNGDYKFYEINAPNSPQAIFARVVDKNLILAASSKESLIEGLDKQAGKRTSKLKNKSLPDVVAKLDGKQSLWLVVPAGALPPEVRTDDNAKKILDSVEMITAGITITDKVIIKAGVAAKDADAAKSLQKQIKQGIAIAQTFLASQEQFAPLADILAGLKVTTSEKTLSLEAEISAETIEKLSKLADQ